MEELQPRALSAEEQTSLAAAALHQAHYHILGRAVTLAGNDPALIERFDIPYEAFRAPPAADALEIQYHLSPPGTPFRWLLQVEGQGYEVVDPVLAGWPAAVFARFVLQRQDTHYLIHAGCASRDGRAVIISGASGLGKSTLTAHLAAAGWSLLSDEFSPIRRGTTMVDPYPLRVGLRPGPAREIVRGQSFIPLNFRSEDKQLVTVEQLAGGRSAPPAPAVAVVFLTTELTAEVVTARRHRGVVRSWFTGWNQGLADELAAGFGVTVRGTGEADGLCWADLAMGDLTERLEDFRDCARRHGVLLALVEYEDFGEKDYQAPPGLLRIPAAAGIVELVKRMPASSRNGLIARACAGKAGRLMMELAQALGGLRFYKMTPGRLDLEIAALEAIGRGDEPAF